MSSNAKNLPPNDPKVIAEIVDKVKKQGLFDKFRKDCLADVDTKPAYLNLLRRVDTFCTGFLGKIKWAPDLNKNKLRDSLRNEITQGKMLSSGVGHIVSQVVNPKIQKIFKPEIDAVVCDYFGIDPEEWADKLKAKEQQRSDRIKPLMLHEGSNQQQMAGQGHMAGNQQMYQDANNYGQGMSGMGYMMNQMQPNSMAQGNMSSVAGISTSMAQSIQNTLGAQMPSTMFPTIPGYNIPHPSYATVNPQVPYDPSVPPPNIGQGGSGQNYYPQIPGMNYQMMAGMTGEMYGMQQASMTPGSSTETSSKDQKEHKEKSQEKEKEKKKELASLTVEDLLNVAIPGKSSKDRGRDSKKSDYNKDRDRDRDRRREGTSRSDSGSPGLHSMRRDGSRKDRMDEHRDERRSDRYDERAERERLEERRRIDRADRLELERERERERENRDKERDRLVRDKDTGDYYRESTRARQPEYRGEPGKNLEPIKPPSPPPPPESERKYHFAWEDEDQGNMSDMTVSSIHTSDLSSFDDGSDVGSGLEDISSEELHSEDEGVTKPPEPPEPPAEECNPEKSPTPTKPRKLLALQYNYSDSEEEETREERKARIAGEKEERYLKRQLRRAELEARKEEKLENARKKAAEKKKLEEEAESQGIEAPSEPKTERKVRQRKVRADRTKEALKEKLMAEKREQKAQQMVMAQRKMALRRQRKRPSKYMSDDFTSIFTDKRKLLSNESYMELAQSSDPDYSPTGCDPSVRDAPARDAPIRDPPVRDQPGRDPPGRDPPGRDPPGRDPPGSDPPGRNLPGRDRDRDLMVSPSTPTQDEVEYADPDVVIVGQEKLPYEGRRTRRMDDHRTVGRPTTPPLPPESLGRGRRRQRTLSSGRHSPEMDLEKKPSRQQEADRAHSQRYDDSDLYKPHTSYRTRRRGTSPIDKDPVPARRYPVTTPPSATRGVRPPSPPLTLGDEHRQGSWQRHGSQERIGKVAISPDTRKPGYTRQSPGSATRPVSEASSSGEEGAEKRVRVPLSMISFGQAAKQAKPFEKMPEPRARRRDERERLPRELDRERPPRELSQKDLPSFGEAARRAEKARRTGDLSVTTTTIKERQIMGAVGSAAALAASQAAAALAASQKRGHGARTSHEDTRGRPKPREREYWKAPVKTPRPLKDEQQEWGLVSDEEGEHYSRVDMVERSGQKRTRRMGQEPSPGRDLLEDVKEGRPPPEKRYREQYRERPLMPDPEERALQSLSQTELEEGEEPDLEDFEEIDEILMADEDEVEEEVEEEQLEISQVEEEVIHPPEPPFQPPEPAFQPPQIPDEYHEHLESVAQPPEPQVQQPSEPMIQPPEPTEQLPEPPKPQEEQASLHSPQPVVSQRQRSTSVSSNELKDDEDLSMHTELPKAGLSPTARPLHMTEMPRAGMSPSERDLGSPTGHISMRSPPRSTSPGHSPSRSRSPMRSMQRSPSRTITHSPGPFGDHSIRSRSLVGRRRSLEGTSTPPPGVQEERDPRSHLPPAVDPIASSPESGEVGDNEDSEFHSEQACVRTQLASSDTVADHPPPSPPGSLEAGEIEGEPGEIEGEAGEIMDEEEETHSGVERSNTPSLPNTRSTRKRTEEEALPIAKRLRR